LMDIQLDSDMTGIEAAEQIKNVLNIPLIYITAYADDLTLKKAKITEPFAYLLKPFEEKELKAAVEMAIYKYEIEKEKQKTRNMFRMLVETMNDGLIIQDEKGFITYANYRFCRMMGPSQHDIIGEYYTKFLEKNDLVPFVAAKKAGVTAMMLSHILYTGIDKEWPASLSEKIAKNLLRGKTGFKGIVMTDDLDMKAIKYDIKTCVHRILKSEIDIALICHSGPDIKTACEEIYRLISENQELYTSGKKSMKRIMKVKQQYLSYLSPRL